MSAHRPSRPPGHREATQDALVGRVLRDKFTIEALIARGAMGKVYRARQAPLGRACAVKVLTAPEGEGDAGEFHQRFLREASIGAKLTHPNTVTIFDYGVEPDGVYFIAMELLEGKTLSRLLRDEAPLDPDRATHIARQICRSLREAHTLGVVHRDLKPANVYLVSHGDEQDVVKVLDFGLVKRVEAEAGEDLTQAGVFVGSPKYMAPEQIRGEHVDARADIYALGTLLYEMLTGHVPFERSKPVDTLLAQVNAHVPPMRDKKKDLVLDPRLEALVMRCLEKDPADRFASMDEVLAALKLTGGAATATATALELLRATPRGASSRPPSAISGEIPAAAPMSQAPMRSLPPHPVHHWLRYGVAAAMLAVGVGVLVVRTRAHTSMAAPTTSTPAPIATHASARAPVPMPAPVPAPAPAKPTEVFVTIDSDPSGARVRDEQRAIVCDATPCKLRMDPAGAATTVIIDAKGYRDEKIRVAPGDPPHVVTLTKSVIWHPAAPTPTKTSAPPTVAPPTVPTGPY